MLNQLDNFYSTLREPNQSCMLALRDIILEFDENLVMGWKYKLPFFLLNGKMFCYLWIDKKTNFPYIGIVKGKEIQHAALVQGNRTKMKILPINPNKDIPVEIIYEVLSEALKFY